MVGLNKEEILKERKEWYSHDMVLFEIVKCLNHKELCFLSDKSVRDERKRLRYFRAWAKDFLLIGFKTVTFDKYLINIYHSVANYKNIPMFTLNLKKRTEETRRFNKPRNEQMEEMLKTKNFHELEFIYGMDLFLDFDSKSDNYYQEAEEFKKIIDDLKLPYYVLNSSSKGFHFVIESKYLPQKPTVALNEDIKGIMSNIKAIYEFKCLDNSIHDIDRVKKCPYSYVCDGTIALPLTDSQFKMFSVDMVLMKNALKNVKLFKRGLLVRTWGLSEDQLKKNVLKFWNEYLE